MTSPKKHPLISEEIGIILTKSYKEIFENNFGIRKTDSAAWVFSSDLPEVGIKENDLLLSIDQVDIRKETSTEAIFSKFSKKNVGDDIYFLIVRIENAQLGNHLSKKVRNSANFQKYRCSKYHRQNMSDLRSFFHNLAKL